MAARGHMNGRGPPRSGGRDGAKRKFLQGTYPNANNTEFAFFVLLAPEMVSSRTKNVYLYGMAVLEHRSMGEYLSSIFGGKVERIIQSLRLPPSGAHCIQG